ncbi:MAG: TerB family tellurite resistance protein [Desulfobulbales bacterium]|nr:TerB family tellurite resistance protein [Desulfobulbales bacterium]
MIRKIFEGEKGKTPASPEERERKKHIAAGVLLLEAAHIDDECTEAEMEHVVATLKEKFDLTADCVAELIELAHRHREEAIDLWQYTNHINRHFERNEKLAVMEDVWRIILVDGQLEKHEDHFAHKLAALLRLSHKEMIDAKLRARG